MLTKQKSNNQYQVVSLPLSVKMEETIHFFTDMFVFIKKSVIFAKYKL